ncbi:MAG: hypothetical protein HKN72_11485 [Gemmatimonadetes bacterium]|nr:hypothetical protein [Gemmatimonadota bacterium]NNF13841.1 hypothetical protein [Gemmatimonadota bacterium]NNL31246.1 hypothetical protein [Gemmatimonadota bacterium]
MSQRSIFVAALSALLSACAGGSPALEYGVPTPDAVRYTYGDTTTVTVSIMGQNLEMAQRGVVDYAVAFSAAPAGVNVSMTVSELEGVLSQPMGAPVRINTDDVQGALVFALDREGNAVIAEQLTVSMEASQMVSGLALSHTFFPGLPGRSVAVGDMWVDTVSYQGSEGAGDRSETAVYRYTVVGDTVVSGRSLLKIDVAGNNELSATLDVQGMSVSQRSEVEVEGWVLWDAQAGLMVERRSVSSGSGTASVPVAPGPIPIQVRSTQVVRLAGM